MITYLDIVSIFLLFLLILVSISISLSTETSWSLVFLFIGAYVFIRISFGRYFTTIDESYYLSLLGDNAWYYNIISGYLTPFFLHLFNSIGGFLSKPVYSLYTCSLLMGLVYLFVIHNVYRRFIPECSHVSEIALFMTPFFWWAVIQVRPQQMGVLIGIVLFLFVSTAEFDEFWHVILLGILFLTLSFAHVLSFLVFALVTVIYALLDKKKISEKAYRLRFCSISFSILFAWTIFLSVPFTRPLLVNMRNLFDATFHVSLSVFQFKLVSWMGLALFIFSIYFLPKMLPKRFLTFIFQVLLRIMKSDFFMPLSVVIIVIVFTVQYFLGAQVYSVVYRGSITPVLVFQLGNIFFSIWYLKGLRKKTFTQRLNPLDIVSIILLFLAAFSLGISVFMPRGNGIWGFHNWMIRILQYWVFFAASASGYGLYYGSRIGNIGFLLKKVIIICLSMLVILSVLNTARVPFVYNYDATWDPSTVKSCELFHGVYVFRIPQTKISGFVTENLLRACGDSLGSSPSDIIVSTQFFYISMHPMAISEFIKDISRGHVYMIAPKNSPASVYFLDVVPYGVPVYTNRNKCSLLSYTPAVLVGGPAVNPCTKELEKYLPVKVTSTSVSIDGKRFTVPVSRPWWNATQGIFVIQGLRYQGASILVIEGTNLDATLAGIYYLKTLLEGDSLDNLDSAHYIIGMWTEKDNKSIPLARENPNDKNGFSEGDQITILLSG